MRNTAMAFFQQRAGLLHAESPGRGAYARLSTSMSALIISRCLLNGLKLPARSFALRWLKSRTWRPRSSPTSTERGQTHYMVLVFREPVTNEENRVASVLEHVVNPCVRMDELARHLGVTSATVSKQLRVDMANMIDALRGELPALIHANELWSALDTMGLLAGARVLVDTTDTEIQDLVDAYNSHHKLTTMKSLIFVAHDGRLLGVETGFGGAESDSTIFRESAIYQQVHPYLQRGERPFVGDSSFHHPHCWFPLTEPEIKATGSPAARAPYRVYGKEVQLYRARVEHAIGHAKARWGSLKSIPAMNHTDIVDITNMIFLTWLLEARFQRLNYERGESQ